MQHQLKTGQRNIDFDIEYKAPIPTGDTDIDLIAEIKAQRRYVKGERYRLMIHELENCKDERHF